MARVVEEDGVVEADHHADPAVVATLNILAVQFPLVLLLPRDLLEVRLHLRPLRVGAAEGGERAFDLAPRAEAREVVDARHRADEEAVRHVRQRRQVRLVVIAGEIGAGAAREFVHAHVRRAVADAAAGAQPLAQFLVLRFAGEGDLEADGFEGGGVAGVGHADAEARGALEAGRGRGDVGGHGELVGDGLAAAGALAHEGHGRGEDDGAALAGLHRTGYEGFSVAHPLDVVEDWDFAIARQHEVAMHAVDCEVGWDRGLGGAEALCYGGAAEDAPRPWGVPEGPGIGEDVGTDVG